MNSTRWMWRLLCATAPLALAGCMYPGPYTYGTYPGYYRAAGGLWCTARRDDRHARAEFPLAAVGAGRDTHAGLATVTVPVAGSDAVTGAAHALSAAVDAAGQQQFQ